MIKRHILSVVMCVSFNNVAVPIKLTNSEGSWVWVDSAKLAAVVPQQLIIEAESKGEFIIDAPHTTMHLFAHAVTIAYALNTGGTANGRYYFEKFHHYFSKLADDVDHQSLAYLLSYLQRYFPHQAQEALMAVIADRAGHELIDLSQTDIALETQICIRHRQMVNYPPERSLLALMKSAPEVITESFMSSESKQFRLNGTDLASIVGIHSLPNTIPHIDLARNKLLMDQIDSFALSQLFFLKTIDLSDNQIKTINEYMISSFPYLESLNLARNMIESIAPQFLKSAPQLKHLDLSDNQIKTFPVGFLAGVPDTLQLYLADNPVTEHEIEKLPARVRSMIKDMPAPRDSKRKSDQIDLSTKLLPPTKKS